MVPQVPEGAEVLPLLRYLHGLTTGDSVPALEQLLGSAAGLSAAAITRPTAQWTGDHRIWCRRDLSGTREIDRTPSYRRRFPPGRSGRVPAGPGYAG